MNRLVAWAALGWLASGCVGLPDEQGGVLRTDGGADTGTSAFDSGATPDTGVTDSGQQDSGVHDSGAPPRELVDVAHERELRGVWIATVANINYPTSQGLSVAAQQAELVEMLELMVELNLNAAVFQVRPESDALYESTLEPWSRFLTGSQGGDPGFDPLAFIVAEAHARNIEVHAWLNPYRAKSNANTTAVAPHVAVEHPEFAYQYGNLLWMDPGADPVRQRVTGVVADIVARYDIDGIHFDDYFYPYPDGSAFPDGTTYSAYQGSGGTLGRSDWRRDNVHRLVEAVWTTIKASKPHVRFGISPFGIYRPGTPAGITGLDQYAEIYSDPLRWLDEGWVDYIAPQLYWPTTQTAQSYETLVDWWSSICPPNVQLFAGNYLSQLGSSGAWTVDELKTQVDLSRTHRAQNSLGNIFFHIGPFQSDQAGVATAFKRDLYARPALTPIVPSAPTVRPAAPSVTGDGGTISLAHPERAALRAFVVYRHDGTDYVVDRIIPGTSPTVALSSGRWAISAADLGGQESQGTVVIVP